MKGLVLFTAVETVAVTLWKAFTKVSQVLAIGTLFVGLLAEHIISYKVRNGKVARVGNLLAIAAVETVTWVIWLALVPLQPIVAAVIFFAGLLVGHVLEFNNINGLPLVQNFRARLRRPRILLFTGIETGIGIAFLALLATDPVAAFMVLFMGLFVEHKISGGTKV